MHIHVYVYMNMINEKLAVTVVEYQITLQKM